jgi:hypothetical protein
MRTCGGALAEVVLGGALGAPLQVIFGIEPEGLPQQVLALVRGSAAQLVLLAEVTGTHGFRLASLRSQGLLDQLYPRLDIAQA